MAFDHANGRAITPSQLAVGISRGDFATHIGLVFTDAKKQMKLIHLAWHKRIKVDEYPTTGCWVASIPDIPPTTAKAFIGVLRKLAKRQPQIPYGIDVLGAFGSFSPDGDYKAPKGSDGLTCTTFVSELFRAVGIPVIAEATWPAGVNTEWAQKVCELLIRTGAEADHVAAVQANAAGLRIRPEEFGAAVDRPYAQWEIDYPQAEAGAVEVMAVLNLRCPLLPGGALIH